MYILLQYEQSYHRARKDAYVGTYAEYEHLLEVADDILLSRLAQSYDIVQECIRISDRHVSWRKWYTTTHTREPGILFAPHWGPWSLFQPLDPFPRISEQPVTA